MIQVNQRVGLIATPGAGKSTAAFTLLEKLRLGKYPIAVIDVKNEYGGLPNTAIIYASQQNAAKLIDELKQTNASCIIFMKDMTLARKRKWINKFLLEAQRESRDIPIMIVLDEVRLYAPQGANTVCKEAILDLAQGGRSQGYGCMLISQRCAKIDKDLLGSLTDLYIFKHYLPQDLKYLEDFIPKEKVKKLPDFKTGQAYHLNFQGSTIEEIQFIDNPRKKGGGTPAPTPVNPTAFKPGKKPREEKDKGTLIALIIGVIVILTIAGAVIFYLLRKRDEEEEG